MSHMEPPAQSTYRNYSYDNLRLHITADFFYIKALDSPENDTLLIDRNNYETSADGSNENSIKIQLLRNPTIPVARSIEHIHGLVGSVQLIAGHYLIVITKRKRMGTLHNGHSIWQVEETKLIPFNRNSEATLNANQRQHNQSYIDLINQVLTTPFFYFSSSYDLTHSVQRLDSIINSKGKSNFYNLSLVQRCDLRFLWNHHMLKEFLNFDVSSSISNRICKFAMPLVHGFINIHNTFINGRMFDWALLSRRSCKRAGTRYYMRGVDEEGNCANYVETEQILLYNSKVAALVQTRGSIPLFWNQYPNLKYKPVPKLSKNDNHIEAFKKHLIEQKSLYGNQLMLNLIKSSGKSESHLADYMSAVLRQLNEKTPEFSQPPNQPISYIHFDFHKECSKMRWHRLSILLDQIKETLQQNDYYLACDKNEIQTTYQKGVVRTNCIDCLDRTNVVQSMIARHVLQIQLTKLGILKPNEKISDHELLESHFKSTWADNGDYIATQYTGTPALKSDFTRTGTRSYQGLFMDGYKSAMRYFRNNFLDGNKQDSIDLFLGKYKVSPWEDITVQCPLIIPRSQLIGKGVPLVFVFMIGIIFMSWMVPTEKSLESMFYLILSLAIFMVVIRFFLKHGYDLVDSPKLCMLKTKEE